MIAVLTHIVVLVWWLFFLCALLGNACFLWVLCWVLATSRVAPLLRWRKKMAGPLTPFSSLAYWLSCRKRIHRVTLGFASRKPRELSFEGLTLNQNPRSFCGEPKAASAHHWQVGIQLHPLRLAQQRWRTDP